MKYEYRILYKSPLNEIKDDDPDTWRKTWYLSTEDCPEQLDLKVKVLEFIKKYNLKKRYIIIQRLSNDKTYYKNIEVFFDE